MIPRDYVTAWRRISRRLSLGITDNQRRKDDAHRKNNERRVDRMDVWIKEAEKDRGENDAHIRFLFYWIAYEAAYKDENRNPDVKEGSQRREFHKELTKRDSGRLQNILREEEKSIVGILKLRQVHPSFWIQWRQDKNVTSADEWDNRFGKRVGSEMDRLHAAVRNGGETAVRRTLNDLFRNLSVVRNQIVHGASAGENSRGRTQVLLGAKLLSAFIPCFRDIIKRNSGKDWGAPPFPRVGSGPDDECPPPWLHRPKPQ